MRFENILTLLPEKNPKMAKDPLNEGKQFYQIRLSFFRAVKAMKIVADAGKPIEVKLDSDHKTIYMYFVHTQQLCEEKGIPFDFSIDHMANFCGLDRKKFMKRQKDLEKLGLIDVDRKGNGRNNSYTVNTLTGIELIWADGKLSESRERDYQKHRSKSDMTARPSKISKSEQVESERPTKEEATRETKPVVSNTRVDAREADFAAFAGASLKVENGSNSIVENEDFDTFSTQEISASAVPADWHYWNETISIAAMSLDKLPITDDGTITSHGLMILKKHGINPTTAEASWFCNELLDIARHGGRTFA